MIIFYILDFISQRQICVHVKKMITFCLLLLPFTAYALPNPPPQRASNVELSRYVGHWSEIAAVPNIFLKGC